MATFTLSQSASINPFVINEHAESLDFLQYTRGLWSSGTVGLSLIGQSYSYSEPVDGLDDTQTQSLIESELTTYRNKVLTLVEQIVVDFHNGQYTDFKKARKVMQDLILDENNDYTTYWATMSTNDKKIASKWFVVKTEWMNFYPLEQHIANGQWFDRNSQLSRAARYEAARLKIFSVLNYPDASLVTREVSTSVSITIPSGTYAGTYLAENLDVTYIKNGVEQKDGEDEAGLFDYVEYTLANKSITPLYGITMPALVQAVMDILRNGNY